MLHQERYRFFIYVIFLAPALFALDPTKHITQYDMRIYAAKDGLPMNSLLSAYWHLLRVVKYIPTLFSFQRGYDEK